MSSLNRFIGIGNLGRDPEVKFIESGNAVANFSIAINEKWKGKDGTPQERTEWVRVVAWGKLAELCGQYLAKGKQVCVEGKLQTREWEKDGVKRYTTEVVASNVTFLGGGKGESGNDNAQRQPGADDDLAF